MTEPLTDAKRLGKHLKRDRSGFCHGENTIPIGETTRILVPTLVPLRHTEPWKPASLVEMLAVQDFLKKERPHLGQILVKPLFGTA